ncbi:MAG: extracellular solute-binding protein [Acidimicrobiales bacterium]
MVSSRAVRRGIAVALVGALSLTACSGSSSKSSTGTPSSTLSGKMTFYSGGDVNIENLWTQTLIPDFEKAYPNVKVDYVFSEHGTNDVTTLARVAQAVKSHQASGYDLLESASNAVEEGALQHLFVPVTASAIPNSAKVPASDLSLVGHDAVPYRGSKVVLAYNSSTVKNPPTTLPALLAWIKAHPGQFAYCNPADGGSGQALVQAVVDSKMPASAVKTLAFNYQPSLESLWAPGMSELHSLGADLYGHGTYPAGNVQVIQLLGSGAVQMATVWSDQGLAALKSGQLPSNVKLVDPNPPFYGSPVYLGIPLYTPPNEVKLAEAFENFILGPPEQTKVVEAVSGFPAIATRYLPPALGAKFTPLGSSFTDPYTAKAGSDLNRVWQSDVP